MGILGSRVKISASSRHQGPHVNLQMILAPAFTLPPADNGWSRGERLCPNCAPVGKQEGCCHLKPLNLGRSCYATMVTVSDCMTTCGTGVGNVQGEKGPVTSAGTETNRKAVDITKRMMEMSKRSGCSLQC